MDIRISSYHDDPEKLKKLFPNHRAINTTSRAKTLNEQGLSPFYLGPVPLYGRYRAQNVENAWQYAKCYAQHIDRFDNPTEQYFEWAKAGWAAKRAVRYPMGKDAKPLFSYWAGKKLDYVSARRVIYGPLYLLALRQSQSYQWLKEIAEKEPIVLVDFDGYDHDALNKSLFDVIHDAQKKAGHAFYIKASLVNDPVLKCFGTPLTQEDYDFRQLPLFS